MSEEQKLLKKLQAENKDLNMLDAIKKNIERRTEFLIEIVLFSGTKKGSQS